MKTRFVVPTLLLAGMASFGNAAMASDDFAGVLIGAGSGAIIGHAISGRDGAVVGSVLGALVGVALADDHDRPVVARPQYRPPYGPPQAVVYDTPRARYVAAPIFVEPRPAPYFWRHERQERRDDRWDPGHGRWNNDHDGRRSW
jgi:hypothetical protein